MNEHDFHEFSLFTLLAVVWLCTIGIVSSCVRLQTVECAKLYKTLIETGNNPVYSNQINQSLCRGL